MELGKTEGTTLESTMDQIHKLLNMKQSVLDTAIQKQTAEAQLKRDQQMSEIVNKHSSKIKKTGAKKGKEDLNRKVKGKKSDAVKDICKRKIGENAWVDQTMNEWPEDDYRIFAGDLGNEVSDEHLAGVFRKYSSFLRAKVIRDKRTGKTKGYGFVSFANPDDYVRGIKEMNGKYLGKRPLKLTKSKWKDRLQK